MFSRVHSLIIALSFALALTATGEAVAAPKDDPVVVKVSQSASDLHSVFMALKLATATAKRGHPTTLFVNLEAVTAKQLSHGAKIASEDQVAELFSLAGKVIDY